MSEIIGKIKKAQLGFEDHGIFAAGIQFDYGNSVQGTSYGLGTGEFCSAFIQAVLRAANVDDWSKLVGRTVFVLRDGDGFNASIIGMKPLPTERGTAVIFKELPGVGES